MYHYHWKYQRCQKSKRTDPEFIKSRGNIFIDHLDIPTDPIKILSLDSFIWTEIFEQFMRNINKHKYNQKIK